MIKRYFWTGYLIVVIAFVGLCLNVVAGPMVYQSYTFDPHSPGAIGGTTPAAGAFTTLSSTGQVTTQTDKHIVCATYTSAGINTAIDALGAEGGEVYLPEGDYDVTAVITVDYDNTTIRGAGKGTRLLATNRFVYTTVTGTPAAGETLDGDTNGYTATVVQVDTTNKIVWYHSISNAANYADGEIISWSGGADTTISGAPTEQNFDVIDTNDKSFVIISDLCIYGGSGGGNAENLIGDNDDADYLTIQNCFLFESDAMGTYPGGEYTKLVNNYVEGSDSYGLRINGTNAFIQGNIVFNNTDYGIAIAAANGAVVGNVVDGGDVGIWVHGSSSYSTIANNTVDNSIVKSISVVGDYNIISNNNLYGNGTTDQGIHLDEADYCTITGNFTTGHDVAGIQEDADCQNNLIYGNNCQDTTPYVLNGTAPEVNNNNGPIAMKPSATTTSPTVYANDASIAVGFSVVRVAGDGAAVVLDADPAVADGQYDGQILYIQGCHDTNTVQIADACNTHLAGGGAATLGLGDILTLIWDEGGSLWREISRSDN